MNKRDLFNNESICIFSDAAFMKTDPNPKNNIGSICAASCVYYKDLLIEENYHILHNTTTQRGELYAILLGIMMSYKYRNFKNVRLFSDSQTSIFAVRDRIFNWIEEQRSGKEILGPNGSIKNQDYIMDIIHTIIDNGFPIELYHVRGHVEIGKYESIQEAKELFRKSNNIQEAIDDSLIQQIAIGNDQVDRYAVFMLHHYLNDRRFYSGGLINGIKSYYYVPSCLNENIYRKLVNPRGVR